MCGRQSSSAAQSIELESAVLTISAGSICSKYNVILENDQNKLKNEQTLVIDLNILMQNL